MSDRSFMDLLQARWDEGKFVCVGLDSDLDSPKFPHELGVFADLTLTETQQEFNKAIVDATHDLVCAYKPNLAFYRNASGKTALQQTIWYINHVAPGVPVILDAKQADIGSTNDGYVKDDFFYYEADAVTLNPYLGKTAMEPFLNLRDKGNIYLCRTSNPGAGEFQDQLVVVDRNKLDDAPALWHSGFGGSDFTTLYRLVAYNISRNWNDNGNCAVVVGATYPEELAKVRQIVGDMPILIPGIGAQGGELEATVKAGANSRGQGMIINSSRGIIFASSGEDFAEAARAEAQKMHDDITAVLATV